MATHSSTLAWEIPWTEEPGRLQSMRSHRVGHDLATKRQQQSVYMSIPISQVMKYITNKGLCIAQGTLLDTL